jgi:DNA-binding IclR family transcriptional regulator
MQYKTKGGIQVLARAAAILRHCKEHPRGLSLGEIAEHTGLPRSTVQRIVATLADEGFLLANGDAGSIRIGPQIHAWSQGMRADVTEIAHPHLKRLWETTGETVDLALFRRDHMTFVDQIVGSHRLRAVSAVGELFPLHCTANGKAVLAVLDDDQVRGYCRNGMARFTDRTLTTLNEMRNELRRIKATGLATDREEHTLGISALGMALRDLSGAIYAVSIPMPSVRFLERRADCEKALRAAILSLTAEIGAAGRSAIRRRAPKPNDKEP